jgi:hypothetical protein
MDVHANYGTLWARLFSRKIMRKDIDLIDFMALDSRGRRLANFIASCQKDPFEVCTLYNT